MRLWCRRPRAGPGRWWRRPRRRWEADGMVAAHVVVDGDVDEARGGARVELLQPGLGALEGAVAADAAEVGEPVRAEGRGRLPAALPLQEPQVPLAAEVAAGVEDAAPHGARRDALRQERVAILAAQDQALEGRDGPGVGGERSEPLGRRPHLVAAPDALLGERDRDGRVAGRVAAVEDEQEALERSGEGVGAAEFDEVGHAPRWISTSAPRVRTRRPGRPARSSLESS